MREVNCPGCNKKLGEIDEKELSVTFEKGVKAIGPRASLGIIVFPFECPNCGKTHMQTITV